MVNIQGATLKPENTLSSPATGINYLRAVTGTGVSVLSGVFPFEPITNHGAATSNSAATNTTKLNAAAALTNMLYIPAGTWAINPLTGTDDVWWVIDKDAVFTGATTNGTNASVDLGFLGGRILWMDGTSTRGGFRLGSGSSWLEDFRDYSISISEFTVTSREGGYGVIGASRASDNPASNFQTIGVGGFAYNDNSVNKEPAWGGYFEVGRESLTGSALGIEIDCWTASAADALTPYTSRSPTSSDVINLWLSAGGGTGSPGTNKNSAAIGIHDNGQRFERGIVFMNASIDGTVNEAMSLYKGLKIAWYDTSNLAQSYITGDDAKFITKSDTTTLGHETAYVRKRADGTTATGALDEVHVERGAGWDGSAEYYGTYIQHIQRSAFSGSNARFSVDIGAKNASGTYREISLNGIADDSFSPSVDNVLDLGTASYRYKNSYVVTRYYTSTVFDAAGSGTPEGVVTAGIGSTYRRTNGGAGTSFYVKESGAGTNTGWVGK